MGQGDDVEDYDEDDHMITDQNVWFNADWMDDDDDDCDTDDDEEMDDNDNDNDYDDNDNDDEMDDNDNDNDNDDDDDDEMDDWGSLGCIRTARPLLWRLTCKQCSISSTSSSSSS